MANKRWYQVTPMLLGMSPSGDTALKTTFLEAVPQKVFMNERAPGLHFSLLGVPVRVEPWFFLMPLLALRSRDIPGVVIWAVLVFVGVLLHEFGHAMAMRFCGFSGAVTLHALGGFTQFPHNARPTPRQQFFITLAGPSAGLVLGLLALLAQSLIPEPSVRVALLLSDMVWINVGWSVINLLPVLPWDGGQLLDAGLQWLTGKRRSRVVAVFSIVGGGLIIAAAIKLQSILLGYFGFMGLVQGLGRWKAQDDAKSPVTAGDDDALEARMQNLSDPQQRAAVAEQLAWLRLRKSDFSGARQAVLMMGDFPPSTSLQARLAASENDVERVLKLLGPPGAARPDDFPLLLSALIAKGRFADAVALAQAEVAVASIAATKLFSAGAFTEALQVSTAERIRTGQGQHAYNEACCLCRLGRFDEAVEALQRAKFLGYKELSAFQTDADLAAIRDRPEVQALV